MYKKLITAYLALVVFVAMALPAVAQAVNHPLITHPTGTTLATGSLITGTTVGNFLMVETNGTTKLTCTTFVITGKLTSNTTGNVQANITSGTYSGTGEGHACTGLFNAITVPESLPWCLKSNTEMENAEFQISGGECGKSASNIKLTLKVFGSETQKCVYESTTTTAIKGTFTTHATGDAVLTTPRTGGTLSGDSGFIKISDTTPFELCPKSVAMKLAFTLETEEIETARPFYISE
jgi:hypothetical protein